jgi:hypothetical protein
VNLSTFLLRRSARAAASAATALWLAVAAGCASPPPDIPGFDSGAFRADRNGCATYRTANRVLIKGLCSRLLGLSEPQISALLGRPDAAELGDRGQRVYLYHLTPGPKCGAGTPGVPMLLRVRFNAVDTVSEALVLE